MEIFIEGIKLIATVFALWVLYLAAYVVLSLVTIFEEWNDRR